MGSSKVYVWKTIYDLTQRNTGWEYYNCAFVRTLSNVRLPSSEKKKGGRVVIDSQAWIAEAPSPNSIR